MRFEDRQPAAAVTGAVLAFIVPGVVGLALLIASGWISVAGGHPQHELWGWLSDIRHRHGQTVYDVGRVPTLYWLSVLSAYIVYQLGEILWACFSAFRRALRPKPVKGHVEW